MTNNPRFFCVTAPRFKHKASGFALALMLCASLGACTTTRSTSSGGGTNGGAYYKVGQPYTVNGETYTPHEDYSYDETGIASWYGDDFHQQRTANGEIYNKNELTAAHRTLPLPTLARVTNLENGRSIVVRINDRGPFSNARIIDVSQRAAQLLGFEQNGTAKVRVQVLADESKAIADAMHHYGASAPASAAPIELAAANQSTTEQQAQTAPIPTTQSQAVQTETLTPVVTTPATHEQLLETKPVAAVTMVPVPASSQIYIQAGAFTVSENAAKLQQSLSRLGHTSVIPIVINGTKFYRVRVGPIANVTQADQMLVRVRQAGATGARTVVDK